MIGLFGNEEVVELILKYLGLWKLAFQPRPKLKPLWT